MPAGGRDPGVRRGDDDRPGAPLGRGAPRVVRRVPRARLGARAQERRPHGRDRLRRDASLAASPGAAHARAPRGRRRRQVRGGVDHRRRRDGRRRRGAAHASSTSASPSSSCSPEALASRPRPSSGFSREARAAVTTCAASTSSACSTSGRSTTGRRTSSWSTCEGRDLADRLRRGAGRCRSSEAVDYVLPGLRGARGGARRGHRAPRSQAGEPLPATRRSDGTRLVKVLDFGISKSAARRASGDALTTTRDGHGLARLHVARAAAERRATSTRAPTSGPSASSCTSS